VNNGATKTIRKRSQEGSQIDQGRSYWGQEEEEVTKGVILGVHLSSAEASSSGHWNFLKGHEHHELVSSNKALHL
jgi:hypothetical protein